MTPAPVYEHDHAQQHQYCYTANKPKKSVRNKNVIGSLNSLKRGGGGFVISQQQQHLSQALALDTVQASKLATRA